MRDKCCSRSILCDGQRGVSGILDLRYLIALHWISTIPNCDAMGRWDLPMKALRTKTMECHSGKVFIAYMSPQADYGFAPMCE